MQFRYGQSKLHEMVKNKCRSHWNENRLALSWVFQEQNRIRHNLHRREGMMLLWPSFWIGGVGLTTAVQQHCILTVASAGTYRKRKGPSRIQLAAVSQVLRCVPWKYEKLLHLYLQWLLEVKVFCSGGSGARGARVQTLGISRISLLLQVVLTQFEIFIHESNACWECTFGFNHCGVAIGKGDSGTMLLDYPNWN